MQELKTEKCSAIKGVRAPVRPWTRSRARSPLKANAVAYEKQARSGVETRRAHFTSTSQDHILERKFHALSGRVSVKDGWGYSQAGTIGWVQIVFTCEAGQGRRNLALGGGKWRCGCNFCTSFLCLKMADRPLGLEQQVPCQRSLSLSPDKQYWEQVCHR